MKHVFNLIAAATIALCPSAFAETGSCKPVQVSWDEEFGHALLGTNTKHVSLKELTPCASPGQCAFVDKDRIEYSSNGRNLITSKGIELDRQTTKLPSGLSSTDGVEDVTEKILRPYGAAATTFKGADGPVLLSDLCFINSKHVEFAVIVAFNAEGKIAVAGILTKEERSNLQEIVTLFQKPR